MGKKKMEEGIGPAAAFLTPGNNPRPHVARSLAARLLIDRYRIREAQRSGGNKPGDDTTNMRETQDARPHKCAAAG